MKIFLIGLPGSGKSTLGRKLAELLGYDFVDTDDEIVRVQNRSIEEIFAREGEDHFRQLECQMLKTVSLNENVVISTGGGTPCFFDNMQFINQQGKSIFLDVPVVQIASRLVKGKNKNRPMVKGKTEEEVIEFLKLKHAERLPYYSKAHLTVNSDNLSAGELKDLVG